MSKEQESFERIKLFIDYMNDDFDSEDVGVVEKALTRLDAIDQANPSEALKGLEKMANLAFQVDDEFELLDDEFEVHYDKVKKYILKAQEQEKENAELKKILSIVKEKRIDLESFYITFIEKEYHYNYYKIMYGTYGKFKLTEEEFVLLKRWLG